jgi:osmotically-inducible protein OsmY
MKMKQCWLLVLLLSSVLTGCARYTPDPIEVAAIAQHDRRAEAAISTDMVIEAAAKVALMEKEAWQSEAHIVVNAYNGAVLVSGQAQTELIKQDIIEMIRRLDQVKMVHDHVLKDYPSNYVERNNDAALLQQLHAALSQIRTIPNFDSGMIKVIVEKSVVYLMGAVHRNEGAVVVNVVQHQANVKQIVMLFEYLD